VYYRLQNRKAGEDTMTKSMTPFEALEIEMWSLRNARERNATVPVLLDFAVRQRELPLADAVEATMQIFRRYRARYRHNAPTTARTARLVPEIEAYSNGYRAADGAARVSLSETYVLDIDLIADIEDSGYRQNETPMLATEDVWPTLVHRLHSIGMVVEMQDDPAQVERTGPFTLNVHTALPGTVPPVDVDTSSAWYVLRIAPELGGPGAAEALAVIAEVLGHIFLAHAPPGLVGSPYVVGQRDAMAARHAHHESLVAAVPPGGPGPADQPSLHRSAGAGGDDGGHGGVRSGRPDSPPPGFGRPGRGGPVAEGVPVACGDGRRRGDRGDAHRSHAAAHGVPAGGRPADPRPE
jgi:hypothetical protein